MKIIFLSFFFLFANICYSQKGNFYITPILGAQMSLSRVTLNNYTKGILQNNVLDGDALYGIQVEKQLKNGNFIFLGYQNGKAGYSVKVDSKPCANYSGPISIDGRSSAYNNKRISLGYQLGLNNKRELTQTNFFVKKRLIFSLAIDVKGSENDTSGIIRGFSGPNRCGEIFFTEEPVIPTRKPLSIALPLGINFELMKGQKRRLGLSIIYTQGLTTNTLYQLDYVTATYRDIAKIKSKGSGIAIGLYYPISLQKGSR